MDFCRVPRTSTWPMPTVISSVRKSALLVRSPNFWPLALITLMPRYIMDFRKVNQSPTSREPRLMS